MRRRPGFDFGGIFFLFILIGSFGGILVSGLLSLLAIVVPVGIIGYAIYKLVGNKNTSSGNSSVNVNKNYGDSIRKNVNNTYVSNMSVPELNKIDKKLTSYFKNSVSLPVIDTVSLTTQSGKFTTVDQLYLTYKDEKICKLAEFKQKFPDVYKKIMELLLVFSSKSDDVLKANVETNEIKQEDKLFDADKYINKIDELNRAIPQEEITNGLYQTCDLLKKIDVLSETHSDNNKISKLYDYYLPILTGALEKYKKLQDAPVHGDEFKECEASLIKTIVLINEALKTICSSMQEDDYMNINADINTLQSLLKKDGYGEDPFGDKK